MKENKNNILFNTLVGLDINKLKDDELIKISKNISKDININGLRRHVNYSLFQIVVDETIDNNKKLEIIKNLLQNQKTIETNVRNFRRKSITPTDVKDVVIFIKTTTELLKTIQKYEIPKEEKKPKETKENKTTTKTTTPTKKTTKK